MPGPEAEKRRTMTSETHEARAAEPGEREAYDVQATQEKWLPVWDALAPFRSGDPGDPRPKKYVLDMFPYPSGDLHMGHAEAYALGDVIARYWVLRGFNVMHPIGWDAFGLPAENAAIKRGNDPAAWTYENIATQKASMRRFACSFDWDRVLNTCDPEFYRWNQWLFLRLFERGLAYRKPSQVNWCPKDQTVLANEQVVGGLCERCDTPVTKKKLTQWYFKITDYADRLLDDMAQLEGHWPDKVLSMQRNWIGRSTGADVRFAIEGRAEPVTVYTTRPDTLYGATFFVVAADSDLAAELAAAASAEVQAEFAAYVEGIKGESEIERMSTERPKTGVALGLHAVNPVNGALLPIYASDYVLADYGHGAIMAVPAHDQRDLDFARAFGLPVQVVVASDEPDPAESGVATPGDGVLVNSGPLDGLRKAEAIEAIVARLEADGRGRGAVNYRLRDWLISRQRYWGTPIPIVHCPSCGEVPVPDAELPVRLPSAEGLDLKPKGTSPLGAATDWVNVACPRCGGAATRDTDTMDTFVDSSWYFLRYLDPAKEDGPFDPAQAARVDAGRPVRRRRHARDPAPAVQPVLHEGAARPGLPGLHRAVLAPAQPGHGADGRLGHEQVAGQPGAAVRRAGGARRRRGAAEHGLRGAARGRHRLGRRVAGGLGEVPLARLAAVRRGGVARGHGALRRATWRCAARPTGPSTTCSGRSSRTGSTSRWRA